MGLLALDEVLRRRPGTRIVLFGDTKVPRLRFPHEFAGVLDPATLAQLYNEAAIGCVISLTNYSLIPKEMMACGLPVVDVHHPSVLSVFGGQEQQVIELADTDFLSMADSLTSLLDDPERRRRIGAAGREFVQGMTWSAATDQIEDAVRRRLAERWSQALDGDQSRSASVPSARR
jgi:glycosyltransferase involved in cell wall biosynthesis